MSLVRLRSVSFLLLCAAMLTGAARGQAKPSAVSHGLQGVEIYGGYGDFHPYNSTISGYKYPNVANSNATASVSLFFTRHLGFQMEGSYFSGNGNRSSYPPCVGNCIQNIYTGEAGPVVRFPIKYVVPFFHVLGGGVKANGPAYQPLTWGYGILGGGGLDVPLPYFHQRFAIRPIQADYQYARIDYGVKGPVPPSPLPANSLGGIGSINALKVSAGLVVRFGETEEKARPLLLGCTSDPVAVFAGENVRIAGLVDGLNPKKKATYTWASNAGKITPEGSTAVVDTTGVAPGEYEVVGRVSAGSKPSEQAYCKQPFTVKEALPPTLSCSANPSSVAPGTPVTITSVARSPQGRPLTYSYVASSGQISGTGSTAELATTGLTGGDVTVICTVADDSGKTAKATAVVTIVPPPPPPAKPSTSQLCSLSFVRDVKRPMRVDNEAKGCLDEVALALNRQADAKLVIVGNTSVDEKPTVAAERALNARQYLSEEKGIDASRIDVRVGETSGKTANITLVPAGATYDVGDTKPFNEQGVVRHGQPYPKKKVATKGKKVKPAAAKPTAQ